MRKDEHILQRQCVGWFRENYPGIKKLLVAIPNGGKRDIATAKALKDEGVVPGAPDLVLFISNREHPALCIEMKTKKGRQSESQKEWQEAAEKNGLKYAVIRDLFSFIKLINEYINDK